MRASFRDPDHRSPRQAAGLSALVLCLGAATGTGAQERDLFGEAEAARERSATPAPEPPRCDDLFAMAAGTCGTAAQTASVPRSDATTELPLRDRGAARPDGGEASRATSPVRTEGWRPIPFGTTLSAPARSKLTIVVDTERRPRVVHPETGEPIDAPRIPRRQDLLDLAHRYEMTMPDTPQAIRYDFGEDGWIDVEVGPVEITIDAPKRLASCEANLAVDWRGPAGPRYQMRFSPVDASAPPPGTGWDEQIVHLMPDTPARIVFRRTSTTGAWRLSYETSDEVLQTRDVEVAPPDDACFFALLDRSLAGDVPAAPDPVTEYSP